MPIKRSTMPKKKNTEKRNYSCHATKECDLLNCTTCKTFINYQGSTALVRNNNMIVLRKLKIKFKLKKIDFVG